jgi:TonB-linked SusC/RagA family outer membrane protein
MVSDVMFNNLISTTMNNKKYISLLVAMFFLVIFTGDLFGQRRQQQKLVTITSTVKGDDGTPVQNAVITSREGAIEVYSDANGNFTVQLPATAELYVEAEGFESRIVSLDLAAKGIVLPKAPFLMGEDNKVSVPFGNVKRKEVVSALNVIEPKKIIKYDNTQFVLDALSSRVPGMLGNMNIRGIGNALFIVDGIPRDASNINVEEIDQITVLKDANAAVLYGTQAKNGVILVTTKRGQSSKRINNISVEQGIATPITFPKYLNSADYMTYYNEALVNDGLTPLYSQATIDSYASGTNPYRYPSVDYYSDEFLKSMKPFSKVLAEFSGGNDNTQYYTNVGWMHKGNIYELRDKSETNYNRINVRANVDVKLNDYIKATVDAVAMFDINKNPNGNFWGNASTLHPDYFSPLLPVSLIMKNATFTDGASLETMKLINGSYILGGTTQYKDNAYGNMMRAGYSQNVQRNAQFNNGFEFDLRNVTEGLKFRTYLTFDINNGYNINVTDLYAVYQPTWSAATDSISSVKQIGKDESTGVQNMPRSSMTYLRRIGTYATLDWARTFNDVHSFSGTLLGYYDTYRIVNVIVDSKNAHLGLRATYDYAKKYFVDFSSAYVNGYKLKPGHKGGLSPTIGLAWVISDENFLKDNRLINFLKVKGTAGIINTEFAGTDYRMYESTFVQSSNSFAWGDGNRSSNKISLSRSDNPDLTFEKMKTLNLGVETYLFNYALYLHANAFATKYSGQVIQRSLYTSYTLLNAKPYENYNETAYKGVDLGITLTKKLGDFSVSLSPNMLYASSERTKYDEIVSQPYLALQGRPVDASFGLQSVGFFTSPEDIAASPVQMFGEVKPGDIKYVDQNGDNIIDDNDRVQIGNSTARFSYGLNLIMKYKNLTLFAFGNGRNGYNGYYNSSYYWVDGNKKYSEMVLNRWTEETSATATFPRLSSKANNNNYRNSTFWLYNADFFTLDRVQLTYDLPKNLSRKLFSKDISLYLRGENLARFSKDATRRQIQVGAEPLYRNYGLGARIEF